MRKHYVQLKSASFAFETESEFLAGSRPIVMEADVTVTPFEDGNASWVAGGGSNDDFTITFD